MSGFRFRLERVLHWRALELAAEESKLKLLIEEEARLNSRLVAIRIAIAELPAQITALDDLRGTDLNRMAAHRIQLSSERERIAGLCREKRRAMAAQVEVHRKAKQRHQLLLELRGRKQGEWNMQMLRVLDELAHESYLARWSTTTGSSAGSPTT